MFMFTAIWIMLAVAVAVLVIVRRRIAGQEDDALHIADSEQDLVARQREHLEILGRFDRWTFGLTLTIIGYSLLLIGRYIYIAWHQGQSFMW